MMTLCPPLTQKETSGMTSFKTAATSKVFLTQVDFGHVYIYLRPVHQLTFAEHLLSSYLSSLALSFVPILFD